jgi:hypothetical protein
MARDYGKQKVAFTRSQLPGEQDVAELGAAVGSHHRPIRRACDMGDIALVQISFIAAICSRIFFVRVS